MRFAYREFLKNFEIEPTDAEFDALNGPPLPEVVRRLKAAHALKSDDRVLLTIYCELIDRAYTNVAPSIGARALLRLAKENRCSVGIVTSNSMERTKGWLTVVNLAQQIDFIVSGDEVQHGKPHPEPYLLASQRTSCPRTEIVVVEDSPQGARSALDAGLKTFALTADFDSRLWPEGAVQVSSLHQLMERLW